LVDSTNPNRTEYDYDYDGNMTNGFTPDGYLYTAEYDAENRMKSIEYTDISSDVHRYEFVYRFDGFLEQIKSFLNGNPQGDIRIIRDGLLPIQERDELNSVTREYTWGLNKGGGIGGLLAMNAGGQEYSYLYDGKGNVSAILDSNQVIVAKYRYDAFGNLKEQAGSLDQPFMFSTKRYFSDLGLSYYGYRFYSPEIGKWMSRDPIGEAGGLNLYGFVQNNPVNFVDPEGLVAIADDLIIAGGALIIGAAYYAMLPPDQQEAMANDVRRFWDWLWNENTEDEDGPCPQGRGLGEKWDDFNENPDDWEKIDQKDDPRQPQDGYSRREKWRNKKTGEELGVHQKLPSGKTRKGRPKHPHPFPPEAY
jgi:RHS repeat-associated protein